STVRSGRGATSSIDATGATAARVGLVDRTGTLGIHRIGPGVTLRVVLGERKDRVAVLEGDVQGLVVREALGRRPIADSPALGERVRREVFAPLEGELAVLVGRILDPVDVLVDRKNRLGEISAEGLVAGPNVEVKLHAFFGGVVAEGGGVSAGLTAEFFSVHEPGDVIRGPLE